ncbi:biotin synthase BioB [Sphingosinicellaceae bacterium]|nr:biotin synthase BioB [Sphingosinicellaceae bacterium]
MRHDWRSDEVTVLYEQPFPDLLFEAQRIHRTSFDPTSIEIATLLSIKTGGCPEDCGYCSQSASLATGVKATKLMEVEAVIAAAEKAKAAGATRFCLGAAWRSPKERDLDRVIPMIEGVRRLGMETCVTLGMLDEGQAKRLADAGLDYYNHNIDTSPRYYPNVATTRSMADRLRTLENVRASGVKVCCGGIIGLGESVDDRLEMLRLLANLPQHPESVPLNLWNYVEGAPISDRAERPDGISFARLVAVARILMPRSVVRIAAGRQYMSDELQALCFAAGVNSIFNGEVLLTTPNPDGRSDQVLLDRLGLHQARTPHIVDCLPAT